MGHTGDSTTATPRTPGMAAGRSGQQQALILWWYSVYVYHLGCVRTLDGFVPELLSRVIPRGHGVGDRDCKDPCKE